MFLHVPKSNKLDCDIRGKNICMKSKVGSRLRDLKFDQDAGLELVHELHCDNDSVHYLMSRRCLATGNLHY